MIRVLDYPRASTAAPAAARRYHASRRIHLRGATPVALTDREIEVVNLICEGCNNESIGNILDITEDTVKRHNYNIFEKLHVNSRTEVAVKVLNARHAEEIAMVRRECDFFDPRSN